MSNDDQAKFPYPKGSEWKKWDLHIHTPLSIIQHYGGDQEDVWEKFVNKLEKLPTEVTAIGINDYYFIDGYEKLIKEYKNKGRLQNLEKIFPILEFRIDTFASAHNNKFSKINLHIVFDLDENNLEEEIQKIKEEFIERIPITGMDAHETKILSKQNFIKYSSDNSLRTGFGELIPPTKKVFSTINSKDWKDKTFVILGYTEWNNLDKGTQLKLFKQDLYRRAKAFFTASPSDAIENKQEIIKKFGEKSLLHSLDIHNFPALNNYNCLTWIKADPTFEGLKQIYYEPADRVHIGESAPSKAMASKVIKSITLKNSNNWFEDNKTIELNPDMVSVIGGRGTGKTALLDILTITANKDWQEISDNANSFLVKAKNKISSLSTSLEWADGTIDNLIFNQINEKQPKENSVLTQKVVYLSQGFIDSLCSEEKIEELEAQIESVIFQNVKDEDKAIYSDFEYFKTARTKTVRWKRSQIQSEIQAISKKLEEKVELLINRETIKLDISDKSKELKETQKQIASLTQQVTKKKKDNKILFVKYAKLNEERVTLEKKIAETAKYIREADGISNETRALIYELEAHIKEINQKLTALGISNKLQVNISPKNISNLLDEYTRTKQKEIRDMNKTLREVEKQYEEVVGQLKLEKAKRDNLETLSQQQKNLKEKIEALHSQQKRLLEAEKIIPQLNNEQKSLFVSFLVTLFEEKAILEDIYRPLKESLTNIKEEQGRFGFEVKVNHDHEKMAKAGNKFIDHRAKGTFQNKDENELLRRLMEPRLVFQSLNFSSKGINKQRKLSKENIKKANRYLDSILASFVPKQKGIKELKIKKQLTNIYSIGDFYNWLYNLDFCSLSYSIKFDGKTIDELTPGLKGIALLILYLELDKDLKPIIIDQPEENLDNRSTYTTLREYFRKAKRRRQVVIATHNANLVVNADSEQVLVANFDKNTRSQKAKIAYVSGALENSFIDKKDKTILYSQGIRQHCWYILEGGPEAFQEREQKYNFPIE